MRPLTAITTYLCCAVAIVTGMAASSNQVPQATIEQMPATLETEFALSALPAGMRGQASVYLLDPGKGYQPSRQGTSGVTCLIERTAWERADFRNDIYVPLCYDAAGTHTFLKVIIDAAALRIQGMSPAGLKAEIESRYRNGTYKLPERTGVSYMIAPVQRTWMLPDGQVHTGPMPHLMFYAPNLTDEHIGAVPNSEFAYPFLFKEGIAEQSYIIQLMGEAEKIRIVADGKRLLAELCAYRDVLCLPKQSVKPPTSSQQDMPAWMRRGLPGSGHAALSPLVGTWRVRYEVYGTLGRRSDEPPIVSEDITTRREWMGDGRFIEDATEGTLMGAPLWRRGWLGYSNMDRRYEWITIDSVNPTMMTFVGATGSGPKLPISMDGVFTDQGVAGEETVGKRVGIRTVIRIDSDDRHMFELYFKRPGDKEVLALRSVYVRVPQ